MDWSAVQIVIRSWFAALLERVATYLPNLVGAVILMLTGWIVGRLLRASVRRIAGGVMARLGRLSGSGDLHASSHPAIVEILASGVYWLVFTVFLLAAVHLLQLPILRSLVAEAGAYLPHLVAASVIVLVGYVAGGLARGAIVRATRSSGVAYGDLLGRIAQTAVVLIALVVAVEELGIDNTFLVMASGIFLASTLGGAAVAFGLGARTSVGNLLASHYVQRNFRPGHVVRIGTIEGRILEIGETSVVLETAEGRVHIPARLFSEEISTLLAEGR